MTPSSRKKFAFGRAPPITTAERCPGLQYSGFVDPVSATYSRTPGDVLNIVYLTKDAALKGGFFPNGVNGALVMSSAFA